MIIEYEKGMLDKYRQVSMLYIYIVMYISRLLYHFDGRQQNGEIMMYKVS